MLMFISFPAIVNEWVMLNSLAFSLRNEAYVNKEVSSIAKPVVGVNRIFNKTVRFCEVKCFRHKGSGIIGYLLGAVVYHLYLNWQGLHR